MASPRLNMVRLARLAAVPLLVMAAGMSFRTTEVARFVDVNFVLPAYFQLRSNLGMDPVLDPKIKIFAFDDSTVAKIKMLDLPLKTWGFVMRSFVEREPKRILIDKIFDKPYEPEEIERFGELMGGETITTVGFVSDREIPLRSVVAQDLTLDVDYGWQQRRFFYGANPGVEPYAVVGHAVYDGEFTVAGLVPVAPKRFVPHWCFLNEPKGKLDPASLEAKIKAVSGEDYEILVNFINPDKYKDRLYSLWPVLANLAKRQPQSVVEKGDSVLIMPAMYTGNTDFKRTPFGVVPGGHVMVSLLNSVLTDQWLTVAPWPFLQIAFAVLLSVLISVLVKTPSRLYAVLAVTTVGWIAACFLLFLFANFFLNWLHPWLAFAGSTAFYMAGKTRTLQIGRVKLEKEIETAQIVQSALLTRREEDASDNNWRVIYQPAAVCSGDWWCAKRLEDGRDLLILIDATGHGVSAALISAVAHAGFYGTILNTSGPHTPAGILRNINRICCQQHDINMTAIVALIDRAAQQLTIASAGHCQPLVVDTNRAVKTLRVRGNIIGINEDEVFKEMQVDAPRGSVLLLFSDGLNENVMRDGSLLSRRDLQKLLEAQDPDVVTLESRLKEKVERHRRDIEQDDVTVMLYQM